MAWTHFNAEGDVEFKAVLFIPPTAAPDLFENYYINKATLKLYVRRVFISDTFDELLPKYLSFLKVYVPNLFGSVTSSSSSVTFAVGC
jgi:heat shock protein beta